MKMIIGGAYLVKNDFGKHLKKGFAVILQDYNSHAEMAKIEFNGERFWIDPEFLEPIDGEVPTESENGPQDEILVSGVLIEPIEKATFEFVASASKPAHYDTGIDTIAFLRANCPPEQVEGFLRGNAIKYLQRYASKGTPIEDLKKSRHYIDMLIEELEGRE